MRNGIKSIQFLRFIAASLVVITHSMESVLGRVTDDGPRGILYITNFGGVGVHIFFVISGFIMVYTSFGNKVNNFDSLNFILRRFIRIYPIYWICAAMYFLFHQVVSGQYSYSIWEISASILLFPGYSSLIIGQGWTLSYEVYFYICFAFFMTLGLSRGLLLMTLFFLASVAVGLKLHSDSWGLQLVTNSLLIEFLGGAWIAYLFVSKARLSATLSNALVLLAFAAFTASLAFGYNRLPTILTLGVPSALLIAGSVFKERGGNLPAFVQRYSFLGDSSYSLYLIHFLLISLLLRAFFPMFSNPEYPFAVCLLLTALCIVIAIVLYELVERRVVSSLQAMVRNIQAPKITKHVS